MRISSNTALSQSPVMFQPFLLPAPGKSHEGLWDNKYALERRGGVNKLQRSSPACWGCCSNWERAHTCDIHGKLPLRPHGTLRVNLMACKPMNSAYLVSDVVSFCEILFYKQKNVSNQMATFTHFKVPFDFPSDIKRHCSSTQVSYLQRQSLQRLC